MLSRDYAGLLVEREPMKTTPQTSEGSIPSNRFTNRVWVYDLTLKLISVCGECASSRKHRKDCKYYRKTIKSKFVISPYLIKRLMPGV